MKKEQMKELIEQQKSLLQTYYSHIDTLKAIIRQLQKELKLIYVTKDNPVDIEEQQQVIKELIDWIDLLMEKER